MTARKGLVLDAVVGSRVPHLLETYEDVVRFCSPDMCFQDARKYVPRVAERRRRDPHLALSVLEQISQLVEAVDPSLYEEYESAAKERVLTRDPNDWPVVAVALLLKFPIWRRSRFLRQRHRHLDDCYG